MNFKPRPFACPVICGSVLLKVDLSANRAYRIGEEVTLRPDVSGLHDDLAAEVKGLVGDLLNVEALHEFYASPAQRVVKRGEKFTVSKDRVFRVAIPDSLPPQSST